MIDIQIKGGTEGANAPALAELIASALHGDQSVDPQSSLAQAGMMVRERQELAESERPSRNRLETVNFTTIDEDNDWTDV